MIAVMVALAAMTLWSWIAVIEVIARDGYAPTVVDPGFDTRFGAGR